ncbi:MAG TPA: site-specific integrase [Aggregatilinea sp.]|uniref:tyrosine-type recombinase/integrase n=1 Tax=Aggregatilinea sp. TaxID=2806333 RepID=UPI002C6E7014|nr:site-specific integrase [Aggregatilinea sp.]HML20121.1 site-specific integrase [Aggregatilinea sp.]
MSAKQLPLFPSDGEALLTRRSPLVDAIAPFQHYLRQEGRSPHTISAFSSDLRLVMEFFGDATPLSHFTTPNLNRFLDWMEQGRGIPCSRKTYARRVTTLKVFFAYLKASSVLQVDPAAALLQRSGAAPLQPILSEDEIQRLLAHTTSLRVAEKPDARPDLLLRLLLDTGIKKSETMALTREHIDRTNPDHPLLVVRHRKPNDVYRERKIELDPDWLAVLEEYLEQYTPKEEIFDCTARNLEYVLGDVAEAAGVDAKVSFEILRWTCMVRDYQRGMESDTLREKMGLSRISWRETGDKVARLAALQELDRG